MTSKLSVVWLCEWRKMQKWMQKDIVALFRSAVEAEDKAWLGDTSTFAEKDFFTQLGWFTNQIEARLTSHRYNNRGLLLGYLICAFAYLIIREFLNLYGMDPRSFSSSQNDID